MNTSIGNMNVVGLFSVGWLLCSYNAAAKAKATTV